MVLHATRLSKGVMISVCDTYIGVILYISFVYIACSIYIYRNTHTHTHSYIGVILYISIVYIACSICIYTLEHTFM